MLQQRPVYFIISRVSIPAKETFNVVSGRGAVCRGQEYRKYRMYTGKTG
jgi:hypothetical protein